MVEYLIIRKCPNGYHIECGEHSMFYMYYSKRDAERQFRKDYGLEGKRFERIEY